MESLFRARGAKAEPDLQQWLHVQCKNENCHILYCINYMKLYYILLYYSIYHPKHTRFIILNKTLLRFWFVQVKQDTSLPSLLTLLPDALLKI